MIAVYAFVMVLSFSRMMFVEFTTSMKLDDLIRSHLNAFEFLSGWTRQILYDNMKQIKQDATTWNPLFMDFCNHHGIVPKTHQPYRARTKGKVERMVSYVKSNFLNGRTFADLSDLNAQARHWLTHTANVRLHGTTNERPVDLWPKESLTSLGSVAPYQYYESVECKVDYEGFVRFDRSRYSVQPELAGTKVWVGKRDFKIVVHCGDLIVVEHDQAEKPGMIVAKPELSRPCGSSRSSALRPRFPSGR